MIVSINVDKELWERLVKKYNLSGVINYFLKKFEEEGKFLEIKEVFIKQ